MTANLMQDGFTPLSYYGKCDECSWTGIKRRESTIPMQEVETHNSMVHPPVFKKGDLIGFVPAILTHGVSAEDFTESHNGAEEVTETQAKEAISILAERIKTLQAKANARDLDKAREEIKGLKTALKIRMNAAHKFETTIKEQDNLIVDLKATIQELLETPDPMPLCKSLEGHNYIPLDQMFVFCTRCGHSIHYKAKASHVPHTLSLQNAHGH